MGRFLQTPVVKFIGSAASLMLFVSMQIGLAFEENPSKGHTLSEDSSIAPGYIWYNASTSDPEIQDVFIRDDKFRALHVTISIFVLGTCCLCNFLVLHSSDTLS